VSSRSTLNAYYERAFQLAATQTRQGRTLTQSLAGTQLIPPHLLSIIATSEEAGRMEDSLKWLATQMEEEALTTATIEMNRVVAFAAILLIIAAFAA
jgi:type II secretory pathway component PulF